MNFKRFADRGGFKLLAVARFSAASYALVCYLLNGLMAKVDEVVTSPGELALLLGVPEKQIKTALAELSESGVVDVQERNGTTRLLRFNLDPAKWKNLAKSTDKKKRRGIGDAKNIRALHPQPPVPNGSHLVGLSADEALVYPLKTKKNKPTPEPVTGTLYSIDGGLNGNHKNSKNHVSAQHSKDIPSSVDHESQRIFDAFLKSGGVQEEFDADKEMDYARLLAEAHPTEHVLQLISHFGREVPSLALLAGAWMHYSETFHKQQHEQVDLESYRQRHQSAEKRIRTLANSELKRAQSHKVVLSADEQLLLRIFLRHEHPRRQLYWALRVRERYPHLHDFFAVTADLALPPQSADSHPRKS